MVDCDYCYQSYITGFQTQVFCHQAYSYCEKQTDVAVCRTFFEGWERRKEGVKGWRGQKEWTDGHCTDHRQASEHFQSNTTILFGVKIINKYNTIKS